MGILANVGMFKCSTARDCSLIDVTEGSGGNGLVGEMSVKDRSNVSRNSDHGFRKGGVACVAFFALGKKRKKILARKIR